VRFKKRELLFIRRMLKAGISPHNSAITRSSAGFSGAYFPIRICQVFFVGNDGSTSSLGGSDAHLYQLRLFKIRDANKHKRGAVDSHEREGTRK
jgi:hypothetical protein